MEERQKLWRARLMGDDETCARKRELYHRFIKGRASQDAVVRQQIRADMPRTFVGVEQVDRANVETLLLSYAAVQQGDGYLQGFNYIMAVVLYVFHGSQKCHADTWWCFSRIVGLVRPLMPDFNVAWFHWCRRQWFGEFHRRLRRRRPVLESILHQKQEEWSTLMTVRWFMIWFAQTVAFEEIPLLWDFFIVQPPKTLMRVYTQVAFAIVEEAATTVAYEAGDSVPETMHRMLTLRVQGVADLLERVHQRL